MTAAKASSVPLPPPPPPPPRALTPVARRRSFLEPNVRFWWLAGVVLAIVTIGFLVDNLIQWRQKLDIVRHGTAVTAIIDKIGDQDSNARANISPDYPVTMQFDLGGDQYSVQGYLEGRTEPLSLKLSVPIRVDPANPNNWTYLTDAPPLGQALLSASLVAPFAIALGTVAMILRRRVLRIWTSGVSQPYAVESIGQTALAPMSRVVRCRDLEGRTKRLVSVCIPQRLAQPKVGDVLWLIHPPGKPTAALPAIAYS
jgi:hypothetical protein